MADDRMSARDAAAILRKRFFPAGEMPLDDTLEQYDQPTLTGDPTGALWVKQQRDIRLGELSDRLVNDEAAAAIPHEGYVQGEPGRRTRSNAPDVFNALRTRAQLGRLSAEAAADPYTGEAEQGRVADVRDALTKASLTTRPELEDAAHAVASRNAFGEFLKKQAGYEAERSDAGQTALDAASKRKVAEADALAGSKNLPIITDTAQGKMSVDRRTGVSTPLTDASGQPIGSRLNAQMMGRAADTAQSLNILEDLEADFPKVSGFFGGVGPASGRFSNLRQALPFIPADRDWARFTANTATLTNQTIKAITGAQMSQGEAERIMGQLPSETLKPEVWQERAAATKRNLRGLLKRVDLLQRGVPASELDKVPLESLADEGEADMTDPNRGM